MPSIEELLRKKQAAQEELQRKKDAFQENLRRQKEGLPPLNEIQEKQTNEPPPPVAPANPLAGPVAATTGAANLLDWLKQKQEPQQAPQPAPSPSGLLQLDSPPSMMEGETAQQYMQRLQAIKKANMNRQSPQSFLDRPIISDPSQAEIVPTQVPHVVPRRFSPPREEPKLIETNAGTEITDPVLALAAKDKAMKETICKFFLNGYCQRGDSCWFSHEKKEETRYTGRVRWYDPLRCHGLVECPEVTKNTGADVTILGGTLKGVVPEQGDILTFELGKNGERGVKAVNIKFTQSRSASAMEERVKQVCQQRHLGIIVTWNQRGFGYISCEPLKAVVGKDVFFMRTELKGALSTYTRDAHKEIVGTQVEFNVSMNDKGPQGWNVELPGQGSSMAQGSTAIVVSGEPATDIAALAIQVHRGKVACFDSEKGFISCDALRPFFGKDIYFRNTECRGDVSAFRTGTEVQFSFHINAGQPKCTHVELASPFGLDPSATSLASSDDVKGCAKKRRTKWEGDSAPFPPARPKESSAPPNASIWI